MIFSFYQLFRLAGNLHEKHKNKIMMIFWRTQTREAALASDNREVHTALHNCNEQQQLFSFTTKHTAQHRDGEKNYTTLHACANFYCSTKWHSTSGWSLSIASRRSTSDTTRAIKNNLLCVRSTYGAERQHCMCQGTQLLYYLKFFHRKSAHALSQWERLQVVAAVSEPRESVKHKFN